jgi:hypothetical protein
MDVGAGLTNTVHFELPDLAGAARLATLLRPYWAVGVSEQDDVALVGVYIRASATDLAALLRSVEDFVALECLCAIRFELDGCGYVMEAGDADWTALPGAVAA